MFTLCRVDAGSMWNIVTQVLPNDRLFDKAATLHGPVTVKQVTPDQEIESEAGFCTVSKHGA